MGETIKCILYNITVGELALYIMLFIMLFIIAVGFIIWMCNFFFEDGHKRLWINIQSKLSRRKPLAECFCKDCKYISVGMGGSTKCKLYNITVIDKHFCRDALRWEND